MKIDTGSWTLWVFSTGCKHKNCKGNNKYDPSSASKVVDTDFRREYGKGNIEGITVEDTVYLTPNIEIKKQLFGAISITTTKRTGYDGIIGTSLISTICMQSSSFKQYVLLGLGKNKFKGQDAPFIHAVEEKKILKKIYGIYIPNKGRHGEITFGGINDAHIAKGTDVTGPLMDGMQLFVGMNKLVIGKTEICREGDDSCKALIDTGCSSIMGPSAKVSTILKYYLSELPNVCIC